MTRSLYSKFILGYLVFGLLGFIFIATISSKMTREYLIQDRAQTLYDEASLIASSYSTMYSGNYQNLSDASPQLRAVSQFLQANIMVVDRSGNIIVDSSGESGERTSIANFDPTATGNRSYTIGTYNGLFSEEVLSVSAPITGNYNTYGYVLIHLPMSQISSSQNGVLNILYISSACVFALSLIILLVFTQTVYLPLRKITEGATQYAAGHLDYRIQVNTHDEMGYLANTLNLMSDELNKMEEYQKNFIANVSHDFRSPLTSIKGYLEAILDGTIPPEFYEKYLSRVISETERLHKLTESMLTLNSLDSKGYLSRSNFDINRVIKDTAASFEGTCGAKNIVFDLTFGDNIQMVYADMGKIQQVMYNLIDNAMDALKQTERPASEVSTWENLHTYGFRVKNNGPKVPRQIADKIFEQGFSTKSTGRGMGLHIVEEILSQYGGKIMLRSDQDETCFEGEVPKSYDAISEIKTTK